MVEYFIPSYDEDFVYNSYMQDSLSQLVSQYEAIMKCDDVLADSSSDIWNSFLGEYITFHKAVIRQVIVERFVKWVRNGCLGDV